MYYLHFIFLTFYHVSLLSAQLENITFIFQKEKNCSIDCNGSKQFPFPDLLYGLDYIENSQDLPRNIFLTLKDEFYLLTNDMLSPYLVKGNFYDYWPVFGSLQSKNISFKSDSKSHIFLKTLKFKIYILSSTNMTVENIIFHGNDANLPESFTINPAFINCYNSFNFCCGYDAFLDESITSNSSLFHFDSLCKFDSKVTVIQPNNPFSFFTIYENSSLSMINSTFSNFHLYSFLTAYSSKIILNSITIENISCIFYFMYCDISNILIQNSTFQNLYFNSSELNSQFIIIKEKSQMIWQSNLWKNFSTTRIMQTMISLNYYNSLKIFGSYFSFNNNILINFILLEKENNLFMNEITINDNLVLNPKIWSFNDFSLSNLKSAFITLVDLNHIIISNMISSFVCINATSSNKIFIRKSVFRYSFGEETGFLYAYMKNIILFKNCLFFKSAGVYYSGLFSLLNQNLLIILNVSSFISSSNSYGGCFYLNQNNSVVVKWSNFTNNTVGSDGGFAYFEKANNFFFLNSMIDSSHAPLQGGVLFIMRINYVVFINSSIDNSITNYHGGFLFSHTNNTFLAYNCVINNTFSLEEGGVIYLNSKNLLLFINSSNYNCTSMSEGGFLLASDQNFIRINSCRFQTSFVLRQAGFILGVSANIFFINNSIFQNATIGQNGLYIYGYKNNKFFLENSLYENSLLTQKGSIFYFDYSNFIYFSAVEIRNNNALGEKIIELNQNNLFNIMNCFFNETYSNHTYVLYAYSRNFIFWENCTTQILNLDYLMYFPSTSNLILTNQKLKNFHCRINLIYIHYFSAILLNKVIFKYDIPNQNPLKLFDINLSGLTIQYSKFYFYETNFSLGIFNFAIVEIIKSEIIRNSAYKQQDFLITTLSAVVILNRTLFYNCNFFFENTHLYVEKSIFLKTKTTASSGDNGGVFQFSIYQDSLKFSIFSKLYLMSLLDNFFILNEAQLRGGVIDLIYQNHTDNQTNFTLNIINCLFSRNRARYGSVVSLSNPSNLLIMNSYFINNTALKKDGNIGKGGCFYMAQLSNFSNINDIYENNFYNNRANVGNVIFIQGLLYLNMSSFMSSNKIITIPNVNSDYFYYGDIIASSIKTLRYNEFPKSNKGKNFSVLNIVSGKSYNYCLAKLLPFDAFNNFAYKNDEDITDSLVNVENNKNISTISNLIQKKNLIKKNGYLCLTNTFFVNSISEFERTYEYNFFYRETLKYSIISDEKLILNLKITSCFMGQRLTDSFTCEDCPRFFFSFTTDFYKTTTCQPCLSNYPFNCFGGLNLTLKSGYWRSADISTNFLKCPVSENCLGDSRTLDENTIYLNYYSSGKCNIGYTGPLCSVCSKDYGSVGNYLCEKCESNSYYVRVFFMLLLNFLFVFYTIHKNLIMCISLYYQSIDIKDIVSTYLLKILVTHSEVMFIIFSLPLEWPNFTEEFKIFLDIFTQSANGNSSWECLLKSIGINISVGYFALIQVFTMQFLILIFSYFYLLYFLKVYTKTDRIIPGSSLKFKPRRGSLKRFSGITVCSSMKTIFLMIFSMNFTCLLKLILEMNNYQEINDISNQKSDLRLVVDYSIEYLSTLHFTISNFISMPSLILIGIFPFAIFLILNQNKKKNTLLTKWTCFYYGYFFYAYEEKYYYWDFVIFMRRMSLIFIGVFFMVLSNKYDSVLPLTLILIILLISYVFQIKFKPFNNKNLPIINKLEKKSLLSLTLTVYITTIYNMKKGQYDLFRYSYTSAMTAVSELMPDFVKRILVILIILLNFLFFLDWIRAFISTIDWVIIKSFIFRISPKFLKSYLDNCFNFFKKKKWVKRFICVEMPQIKRMSIRNEQEFVENLFEKYKSPKIEKYLKTSKTNKRKKLNKNIRNLKELLKLKHSQVKGLEKSIKNLSKENDNLKNNIKYLKDISNIKENKIVNSDEHKKIEWFDKSEEILLKFDQAKNEEELKIIEENEYFTLTAKKPKQFFSKINEFVCFTFLFEKKKNNDFIFFTKIILQKSPSKNFKKNNINKSKYFRKIILDFVHSTPNKIMEISKKVHKFKIYYYFLNQIIEFPRIILIHK